MEVNGHEIKPLQLWRCADGRIAIILEVTDDSVYPIQALYFLAEGKAHTAHNYPDGRSSIDEPGHKWNLIEPANVGYQLIGKVHDTGRLERAAIDAARYLQRKEAGQCANELAHALTAAVEGWQDEP